MNGSPVSRRNSFKKYPYARISFFILTAVLQLNALSELNADGSACLDKRKGYIQGRVIEFGTQSPVCFADISCNDKSSFAKSNSNGEFVINPSGFPVALIVRKFGFKDVKVFIEKPNDSVQVTLVPYEILKKNPGKEILQYGSILKKAIGKFHGRRGTETSDEPQRKLVYFRMTSSVDTTLNSLFESYAHMNVSGYSIDRREPDISRYAATNEYIPGLWEESPEFKIDPFINLPIFVEQYISGKRIILQDGKKLVMIRVNVDNTKNDYYIDISDTSIVSITSIFKLGKKIPIPGSVPMWQDKRELSTSVFFSRDIKGNDNYTLNYVIRKEDFRLTDRKKNDQNVSRSTLFAIVPDSSSISSAVRDQVLFGKLTEKKQQISLNSRFLISGRSSPLKSEKEELLQKPYLQNFWAGNSFVKPDKKEERQIQTWEKSNKFYSENRNNNVKDLPVIDSLVKMMNDSLLAVENVYVETDRPDYMAGDTIWFSAFVMDNLHMDSTFLSRILYVDLINADNKLESHLKLLIENGRTKGEITLKKDLKNGVFRLRAYTQYMRNFQSDYLFEKEIQVHQSDFKNLIVVNPVINKITSGDSVILYIHTIVPDEYKSEEKKLEVTIRINDTLSLAKTFRFKRELNTPLDFFVPASLSCTSADIKLSLSGKNIISERRLSLQLKTGINLQFFPESGKLVDGIASVIAYKAIDNKGNPTPFEADITDENQNLLKHIAGDESGIGKFEFTPEVNHSYKALSNYSGNKFFFNLPQVEPKGFVLNFNSGSDEITIKNNRNYSKSSNYLMVSVRGAVFAFNEVETDSTPLTVYLPLEKYPKGIVQVTLYDSLYRPLAERLVFNNRPVGKFQIHIETDKKEYLKREKVDLSIHVTDSAGNPAEASLAMVVTDLTRSDSVMASPDIATYLYLSSELKGEIDYKFFDLSDTTTSARNRVDLIMMTQGWRNYLWNSIRYLKSFDVMYPIEKGFCFNGSVYNLRNQKPGNLYTLNYLDFKTGLNGIAKTDGNNRFNIDVPFFYGAHTFFIQNRNKSDRIEKLGFLLDTFPAPSIIYRNNELPYYSFKPGLLRSLVERFAEADSAIGPAIKYINLPEVTIKAKSHNPSSAPDVVINLNKKDPTGKKYSSLFQLIYEEFGEKAFTATGYGTKGVQHMPILVADGAPSTVATCPPCYDFDFYQWAASIRVNNISNVKFYAAESRYSQDLTPPPPLSLPPSPKIYLPVVSFTTYSSSYRGNPRGAIVFPYQGLYQAREFYVPDYENHNTKIPDNRTTIYWNPEVKTDSTGKVHISFYNSDLDGEALIRISGVSFTLKDVATAKSYYRSHQ